MIVKTNQDIIEAFRASIDSEYDNAEYVRIYVKSSCCKGPSFGLTLDDITEDDLKDDDYVKIRTILENDYRIEGELRREVSMNIKRLMDFGTYRGMRHRKSLPVNGQRTKTNARTRKGKRKTVAGKKKAPTSK